MTKSRFQEVVRILRELSNDDDIFHVVEESAIQPFVVIPSSQLISICTSLHQYPKLFFDSLSCISAIDNGVQSDNRFEVVYHLYSLLHEDLFILKVFAKAGPDGEPILPSVSSIWKTADWHEREAYDLMGIHFEGHPDLRRILLPADWVGHPLRKDYQTQDTYHGIKVKYE